MVKQPIDGLTQFSSHNAYNQGLVSLCLQRRNGGPLIEIVSWESVPQKIVEKMK